MGIFSRISDIISANLNDMVEGLEDPQVMLRQAVREMETTIDETRQSVARTMADEKMVEKELEKNRRDVVLWTSRAQTAVADRNDELARKAIVRKQEHEKIVTALEDQLTSIRLARETCHKQLRAMQAKLAEAKRRMAALEARQQAADIRARITAVTAPGMPDTGAFAKFDRMREKVERAEAHAEAMQELSGEAMADLSPGLDAETPSLDVEVEAELIELKRKTTSQ